MNTNIFNTAYKISTISLKRLNLLFDHYYQEVRHTIPFIGLEDRPEFNFSLLRTADYFNFTDTDFGTDVRFSHYRRFTQSSDGNTYTVVSCDDYSETFTKINQTIGIRRDGSLVQYNVYLANTQRLKLYVSPTKDEFRIVDDSQTHFVYKPNTTYQYYPWRIYDRLWNQISFQNLSNGFRYFNDLDFIDFIKGSNGYVDTINVYHDEVKTAVTRLTYSGSRIIKSQLYRIKSGVENLIEQYEFTYDPDMGYGTFKETITNEMMIAEMDWNNYGLKIRKGVGLTESNKSKYEELKLFKKSTSSSSNPNYVVYHYYTKHGLDYYHSYDADTLGHVVMKETTTAGYPLLSEKVSYDSSLDDNLNLLTNGNFTSSITTGWSYTGGTPTIYSSSGGEPLRNICSKKLFINGGQTIYQKVTQQVLPNECVRLSIFHKDNTGSEGQTICKVTLQLSGEDNLVDERSIEIKHGLIEPINASTGAFGFKVLEFVAKKKYKSIKVSIQSMNAATFYVKGVLLTKGTIGKSYEYDSLNRITGVSSINDTKYFNDLDGNVVGEFSSKKDYKEHKYGEYNVLLETKDSLGNLTVNTYDTYYFNKVIKAITYYDNYYQQINKTYTNMGKDVQTETGVNNQTTTYNKNVTTRLMDSITDPRGVIYSHLYDGKNLTINNTISDGTNSSNVTTDYYEDTNVKEYVNGNLKYLFTYNNEGKLKNVIKIDSSSNTQETLVQIKYDYEQDTTKLISDNIISITDRNNYATSFEYDLFGNVIKITRGSKIYNFEYDTLQRLKKTYEGTSTSPVNKIEYTYDIKGQLAKEIQSGLQIEYVYDEEGKLVEKLFGETSNLYSEKINNMDCSKKNLYHNKLAVHSHYGFGCFFEKNKATGAVDSALRNNRQEALLSNGIVASHNGKFGYLNCTSSTSMNYSGLQLIGLDSKTGLPLSGSLAFAFKVDSGNTGCLFCLRFVNNICVYGKVELSGTKTYLNIYSQPTGSATLMYSTDISDKLGNWISIGFSYDENTKLTTFVCDDKTFAQQKMLYYSLVGVSSSLYLGCLKLSGSSVVNNLTCQITNVILTRLQLTQNELLDINNENINFLNQNSLFLNKENNANFAQSLTLKNETENTIFPLNRTLKNRVNDTLEVKKKKFGEEIFVYDTKLKDYVFNAKGNLLYKNQSGSSLTVVANVCFENVNSSNLENIIELVDGNAIAKLYRASDNKLWVGLGNAVRKSNLIIPNDTWSTISFGLQPVLSSDSIDVEYYNFRVTVNGVMFETQIPTGIDLSQVFNSFDVYLGGVYSSDNYVMNGYVSDVYLASSYLSLETINTFVDNETIVYHEYNSIGQLIEEGIKTKTRNITKKTYQYEFAGNRNLGNLVKVIQDGVEQVVQMDSVGNIIKLGNTVYEYDYLNRLKKVTGSNYVNYEYDTKGNILSITKNGTTRTFTYENDRITSYGSNEVKYDDYKRIEKYGSFSFVWEGKQLTSLTVSNTNYSYEYNHNGLRTKKTNVSNGTYVKYSYEGDKLIKQYDGTNNVFYLYDDNGVLYGLIWNETKYFYRRNVIGEIIDIIDINGNVVVTYTYDPYGKLMSTTGSLASTLGVINSVLYKGYVYDVETGYFWLSSRYYSPELGRFIQPADVSSLNPRSINGLNLYSFANNNPIGIAYSSFGATFGTSGGMIGSTRGTIGNIVGSGSVGGGSKISGFGSLGGSSFSSINWPKANSVAMTHYTTSLIKNPFISWMLGNISYTKTVQLNSAETFYSFSNIGNDGYSAGVGFNFGNWYGGSVYVSSDIGFGSSWQLTPWLTGSSGWSLENGISISGGVIIGDTTHEITVSIGNGALLGYAACAGIAAIPVPGARVVAATAACIIFIIDLFN